MRRKSTICLDFDGVLHGYDSGYTGVEPIDDPVPGAARFCEQLQNLGYEIIVQSARAAVHGGVDAIRLWLAKNDFPRMEVTAEKPKAILYVDDRGWRFEGDFGEVLRFIEAGEMEPWYQVGGDES